MLEQLSEILDDHRANLDAPIVKDNYEGLYKYLLKYLLELEKEWKAEDND